MRILACICCCYYMLIIILRAEPPFAFLSGEEKRRLCLNHIKPFSLPQPKLLDYSIFFSLVKLSFFEFLKKFIRLVKLTEDQYKYLYPTSEATPRLHCTPKIHKANNPLRPIVDYTGSIGYNTSRALADLLGPLVGTTEHHVKNSKELAEELSSVTLEQEDIFNSHDVQETLTIIRERLDKDQNLKKRTNLEVDDIMDLTEFIGFRGQLLKQKFGTAEPG